MRVLVVSSYNNGKFAPFITEQVDAVRRLGAECEYFGVVGKGVKGYLSNLPRLRKAISEYEPDLIHAHFGLSGLLANLQRGVPVITTYHGSDINDRRLRPFSRLSILLSAYNIFVSQKCIDLSGVRRNYALIPCGVDLSLFRNIPKEEARHKLGWKQDDVKILFAGAFDDPVKNSSLARKAVSMIPGAELVELKGYARETVPVLMSACDALLMTSLSEGSPQVVKEAVACRCPVVSVDVGDVRELTDGITGCLIADRDYMDIADALKRSITRGGMRRDMAGDLKCLSNVTISRKINLIYDGVVRRRTTGNRKASVR